MTPDELAVHRARLDVIIATWQEARKKPAQIASHLRLYIRTHQLPYRVAITNDGVSIVDAEPES